MSKGLSKSQVTWYSVEQSCGGSILESGDLLLGNGGLASIGEEGSTESAGDKEPSCFDNTHFSFWIIHCNSRSLGPMFRRSDHVRFPSVVLRLLMLFTGKFSTCCSRFHHALTKQDQVGLDISFFMNHTSKSYREESGLLSKERIRD